MSDDDYELRRTDVTDFEFGVHALRTFDIKGNRLASIVAGGGHWENGECVARCTSNPDHEAPAENCGCGVYGFFSVDELVSQYGEFARYIVAVIEVEGLTTIGTKGLKTAAARVVAYWCAEATPERPRDAKVCAVSCPEARRFFDRDVMTRLYGLHEGSPYDEGDDDG